MLVSVTRLRLRSFWVLPLFAWGTRKSIEQVRLAEGFAGGATLIDRHWTFWTATVWRSEAEMKAFRGSGTHGKVMPKLARWCDEASVVHWEHDSGELPDWTDAWKRMIAEGRLTPVDRPSQGHKNKLFPAPRVSPLVGWRFNSSIGDRRS